MPVRASYAVSFVLAAAALSGCATLPPDGAAQGPSATTAPAKAPPRAGDKRIDAPAPETLIGSDEAGIVKLVGSPGLVRREKGVDVWQYTDDTCTLLLYFYDKEGARKLTYLEALPKTKDGEDVTKASCLSAQIRAYRAKNLS